MQWHKDNFWISDDIKLLDKKFFIDSLHTTYWAEKRPDDLIEKSILNSTVLSLFTDNTQIGFARIISDQATYAYICDVYIHPHFRKQGLGKWLMQCVLEHPACDVTIITLATLDAHDFYHKFGFYQDEMMNKRLMGKKP